MKRIRQICTKITQLLVKFGTKKIAGGNAIKDVDRLYSTLLKFFQTYEENCGLGVYLWSQTMGRDLRMVRVYYTNNRDWYNKTLDIDDVECTTIDSSFPYNRLLPFQDDYSTLDLININNIDMSLNDISDRFKYITFIISNNSDSWELVKRIFQIPAKYDYCHTSYEDYKYLSDIIQYYERREPNHQ